MKTRFSQVALLVGLALGLMALWAGASPLSGTDPGGVGGDDWCWTWWYGYINGQGPFWAKVASSWWSDCTYCWGTYSEPCSEYYFGECSGGNISVADCGDETAGGTTYPTGATARWSSQYPECGQIQEAWCDGA